MTRVLFAERISFDADTSTSIEGQDEKLSRHAAERGVEVVGRAVDRSVSGDVDFPDRPELKKWLTEQGREEWDELWVTTQDRLSRNDIHFMAFVFRIIEWNKVLVVLDDPSLDLHTPEGRLIAHAKAMSPARELQRIKDRVRDSHQRRRNTPAWPGGIPPYGYTTAEDWYTSGKVRKVLVLEQHSMMVLHEIRQWLVDEGETLQGIAKRLNARGEPTVKDLWRRERSRQMHGERWSASGLLRTLKSEANLGMKLHRKKPLYNRDGSPLLVSEPVFTKDEWESLQTALMKRRNSTNRRNGASPLLGVAWCAKCGKPAYRVVIHKTKKMGERVYTYYRCSKAHGGEKRCPGVSVYATDAEQFVEETFLNERGDNYVARQVYVPASDNSEELEHFRKRVARLREDRENGLYDDDAKYYADKMKEYQARIKELEAEPRQLAHWIEEDTEETYREVWERSDQDKQRQLLLDAGVRLEIVSQTEWHVIVPPKGTPMGEESQQETHPASGTFTEQLAK